MTTILGISAFYHDSAACIIKDGAIIAAAQEERFTRKKHDSSFPMHAVNFCLTYSNTSPGDIDYVVFYEKPILKFDRILETYLAFAPKGFGHFSNSLVAWLQEKLFQKKVLINEMNSCISSSVDWSDKLLFSEHHLSHAASAYFPSPFQSAAVLTMDAVGEWATTSIAHGQGNQLAVIKEIKFPHSLGLLYSAFTFYAGFKVNSGEYKLMGLAPYGEPRYYDILKSEVIEIKTDGSFFLNLDYFDYCTGKQMISSKFEELFKRKARAPESDIEQFHLDIAASIQMLTEEIVIGLATHSKRVTGEANLCLAGGVALNCVANGKLNDLGLFEKIWIQPSAGDAGGALGAALAVHYLALGNERDSLQEPDGMSGAFLGPSFSDREVVAELENLDAVFKVYSTDDMLDFVANSIANEKAVGWMQGRMEFGPRALGARSILADARSPKTQRDLNLKIKFRESFRPFAPSVLLEDVAEWFDFEGHSPYMLMVSHVAREKWLKSEPESYGSPLQSLDEIRTLIPAVSHVDYTARIQTVDKREHPLFYALISRYKQVTGCPVIVNTSFNVRGEPIVCTPSDAFRCFMGTNLDLLVIGNVVLKKSEQVKKFSDYKNSYELD